MFDFMLCSERCYLILSGLDASADSSFCFSFVYCCWFFSMGIYIMPGTNLDVW